MADAYATVANGGVHYDPECIISIEDKNGNGKWDTGNVVERRQPERAEIYANDEGEDTFATKTNWEVEFSIDMNRVFAPVTMESLFAHA